MQTFMPYSSFMESVQCLDRQRLGKQRVETKQLLLALGVPVGGHAGKAKSSWATHPAARMWRGFESALATYGWFACREWRDRGYADILKPQFEKVMQDLGMAAMPPWMGQEDFHASHRSNLLRKLPGHYSQFGWREPHDLPYVWPAGTAIAV